MAKTPTVAFICTGNSCRSQMAEAILRQVAAGRLEPLSAGSRPAGFVHPLALATLQKLGIPGSGLRSKHWSALVGQSIDICITVCDHASTECPIWPEDTLQVQWSLPDPVFLDAEENTRLAYCTKLALLLQHRLTELAALDIPRLSRPQLKDRLAAIAARHPVPAVPEPQPGPKC